VKLLLGLGLIGGAVWLSRGRQEPLGGIGDVIPNDTRGEALDETERAALALYPVVDGLEPLNLVFDDEDYRPNCDLFGSVADDAVATALRAQEEGLPDSYSVFAAATQAWALSQIECQGGESWVQRAVEWPDSPT
jgi:hypothetical protein